MPHIQFSDKFSTEEKKTFSAIVASHIDELALTNDTFEVYFDRKDWSDPGLHGMTNSERSDFNQYAIYLNTLNDIKTQILTTAHEMIHVEQYVHGKLTYQLGNNPGLFWKGEFIPEMIATSNIFYSVLPWEREAFNNQERLYNIAMRKQS